jgi:hypothetical protein
LHTGVFFFKIYIPLSIFGIAMKTPRFLIHHILFGLTLIALEHATNSWACSCAPTTCGIHRYSDADFVGLVLSRRVMPSDYKLGSLERVEFEVGVIESFRGTEKVGEVVRIRTGFGGGDCGYDFKLGAKYLIDASKHDDVLLTGICSLTAPIEDSEVELRSLRRLGAGQRLPNLVGVLLRGADTNYGANLAPLSGVTVEAKRIGGGSAQKTATDAVGSFTFEQLPKGTYELILGLPSNLGVTFSDYGILNEDQAPLVSIESRDPDSEACSTRIIVEDARGGIIGVVQSSGSGVIDGWVNADTFTADDKPWKTIRSVTPQPDGKFFLPNLNPGRYSIVFISRAGFVRGKSQIIRLQKGERRTGVLLSQ